MTKRLFTTSLFAAFTLFGAQTASAELHCKPCPYSCMAMGIGNDHCSFRPSNQAGFCCVDLDKRGLSLALAWEEQNNSYNNQGGWGQGQPNYGQPARESCPPGFTPSEQKCSPQERARGCKDVRLPGGLGCVRR